MELINIQDLQSKEEKEIRHDLLVVAKAFQEAIESGQLRQFVLQYELESDPGERQPITLLGFWNKEENMDQTIGFAQRLLFRILAAAETEASLEE